MVYFRLDRKWKNEVQTEDTSFSEALPSSGILSAILLKARIYNASAMYDRPLRKISDHLSKIVVKANGVESFKDISGRTLLAEWMLQHKQLPPNFIDEMSSNYQLQVMPILFGRYLNDPDFALDLSRFGEVRLEITNDFSVSDLQATKNIWFDIDLLFMEERSAPANLIGTSQISTRTWTAAEQKHTFKVPTKYRVRRILLGAYDNPADGKSAPSNKCFRNLRYLKYTYNSGGKIVKDDDLYRNDQDCMWGFPDYAEVMYNMEPRTGYYYDTMLGRPVILMVTPSYSADPGSDTELTVDQRMEQHLTVRRADAGFQGRLYAAGYGPMAHICIHEDVPDSLEGYLDPAAKADVEIEVGNSSSGATSGTVRFITQHVRANM